MWWIQTADNKTSWAVTGAGEPTEPHTLIYLAAIDEDMNSLSRYLYLDIRSLATKYCILNCQSSYRVIWHSSGTELARAECRFLVLDLTRVISLILLISSTGGQDEEVSPACTLHLVSHLLEVTQIQWRDPGIFFLSLELSLVINVFGSRCKTSALTKLLILTQCKVPMVVPDLKSRSEDTC